MLKCNASKYNAEEKKNNAEGFTKWLNEGWRPQDSFNCSHDPAVTDTQDWPRVCVRMLPKQD